MQTKQPCSEWFTIFWEIQEGEAIGRTLLECYLKTEKNDHIITFDLVVFQLSNLYKSFYTY